MGRPGPNCKPRICKLCGTEFVPSSSRQKCCGREIQVPCAVCGTLFSRLCTTSDNRRTCSDKCNIEYQKVQRKKNAQILTRECKACGKKFHPKHVREVFCEGPHYKNCVICGTSFTYDPRKNPDTQTCSKECFVKLQLSHRDIEAEHEKMRQALLKKYGVDNASKIPGSHEKMKRTMLEKYGKEWYTQTDEYKQRVEATSLQKYGTKHWLSNEDVIEKRKETCLEKYGADNVLGSEYGRRKTIQFFQTNYGVDTISQVHINNYDEWNKFKTNTEEYIKNNFKCPITVAEIAHQLGVAEVSLHDFITPEIKEKYIKRNFSTLETDVTLRLKDLIPELIIYHNTRKIISPYEIDLFLPEYNIGIECNPAYTHSVSNDRDEYYHRMKTVMANEKGIFLFHLFGYEWKSNKDSILSYLMNLIHYEIKTIDVNNTAIKEVTLDECKQFFNENHILQSPTNKTDICIGLYQNQELVSAMSFSILDQPWQKVDEFELQRYCCKNYTNVKNSDEILFNYFVEHYHPNIVEIKVDLSHFKKDYLDELGFNSFYETEPNYFWVEINDKTYMPIQDAYLHELQQFISDNVDYSKSEDELMQEKGFVKVYDSGMLYKRWYAEDYSTTKTPTFTKYVTKESPSSI